MAERLPGLAGDFHLDLTLIREAYSTLGRGTRGFALFSGLSGTGKSRLAEILAKAADTLDQEKRAGNPNYLKVPVLPDWTDPSGLLGYVNILSPTPRYEMTPTLHFLLRALKDTSGRPYFLCLDELNLARVEHYFAPFLSAMDGKEPLQVHSHDQIEEPPRHIPWPANLLIIGTVNVDSTTNPLSDKVLDRTFIVEFKDIDLGGWAGRKPAGPALDFILPQLKMLYEVLRPVGRHFGYRTCDDVLAFVQAFAGNGADDAERWRALDRAVCGKILTKVRGPHSAEFAEALETLDKTFDAERWPASREKIVGMRRMLHDQGAAYFWG